MVTISKESLDSFRHNKNVVGITQKDIARRYVYEAVICNSDGEAVESRYYSSLRAARECKPTFGHVTCIAKWPLEK